jgi:PAS domain S-box-containing protein/diguanylate cyclase (GGDEF)-like protein
MVGQDAGRGDSHVERSATRRSAWGADRQDLETSSLANWSHALDEQRRDVLAGVGHELKTPLSIVLGLCGRVLAGAEPGAPHAHDVERIRANAYVLLKRVDELLQVSRLDGGHLVLEPRDVDVARLVRSSCEGFASVAELRDQQLALEAPAELWAGVDEEKVLSVVSNLLANALKHAPPGGVVRCTLAAKGERLRIEVADSGPGVAHGLREEIFERYRRGAGSAARPGGTGLGLTIVRDLVALHNGTVTLSDAPEGGALFVVELPLSSGAAVPEHARMAPPWTIDVAERQRATVERLRADLTADGRRAATSWSATEIDERGPDRLSLLVVTADAELGAFVEELIATRYHVRHAADALDAARAIAARRPDVVVLDAAAGSGVIAALGRRLGDTPLLTLAASPEDVPDLLRAGAHDCVVKPFESRELEARLDGLAARGRTAVRRAADLSGLARAFRAAPLPMALITTDGRLLRVNRALCALLGFRAGELLNRTVQDLTHPGDLPDEEERRRMVLGRRVIVDRGTWRLARADGSYVRVSAATSVVDDGEGEACLLWHLSEATSEQAASGGAGVLSGPPGRRALERAVRHQLLRCRRYGEQAALVRCSLEGLPEVRGVHGAEVADALVAAILEAVRRRLRGTDVVAYVGDHEVVALLAHADLDAATTTADAIREAAEAQQIPTPGGFVGTSAEVGVASVARAGSAGRAFVDAGLAMQARPKGAASVGRFRGGMDAGEMSDVSVGRPLTAEQGYGVS